MIKTSRNLWSQREKDALSKCIEEAENVKQGCKTASRIIDRTAGTCSAQYYSWYTTRKRRKKPISPSIKRNVSNPTISVDIRNNSVFITKTIEIKV